jgi:hypothetical protein
MHLKKGVYEHYKGKRYRILALGKDSETLQEVVIYQGLYGKKPVWVRPLKMFKEKVAVEGKKVPRFAFVK